MMRREVEGRRSDARFRADIILPTGKVVSLTTDWKPSHWDELVHLRRDLIEKARSRSEMIRDSYGVTCAAIKIVRESRVVCSVTESMVTEKFDSEHFLATEAGKDV